MYQFYCSVSVIGTMMYELLRASGAVNPTNARNNLHPCVHAVFVQCTNLHESPAYLCRFCSHFTVQIFGQISFLALPTCL
jgi:hypothetical protein